MLELQTTVKHDQIGQKILGSMEILTQMDSIKRVVGYGRALMDSVYLPLVQKYQVN